jgi:hypothetical protein
MQARYVLSQIPNKGADPDHPVDKFPIIVFLRDTFNPVASAWHFAESRQAANEYERTLRQQLAEGRAS